MGTKVASRIEGALVLRGVLAVAFGIIAFFTGQSLLALVYVFGAFALLSGLLGLVMAVRAGEAHLRWGWLAAEGIVGVAAGVMSFAWPNFTAQSLVYLVGTWALIIGVAEILYALSWPDTLEYAWLAVLAGVLSLVFGFLLLLPRAGAGSSTWLVGLYAILYGCAQLFYAYHLHAFSRERGALFGQGRNAHPASQ